MIFVTYLIYLSYVVALIYTQRTALIPWWWFKTWAVVWFVTIDHFDVVYCKIDESKTDKAEDSRISLPNFGTTCDDHNKRNTCNRDNRWHKKSLYKGLLSSIMLKYSSNFSNTSNLFLQLSIKYLMYNTCHTY